ncbi:RDD family protein [Streptomyces sp. NPDC032940]|uniref:RDD family protein n=1 Tax=Streptomyces sp. NPDC032940 TaxID=3155366 RepID=UPI0033FB16A8
MSAPTPAPGDDRPREGYYPDPSIPGYVRYWNGASWVAGTSRPAPKDGEPLAPPPGVVPAAAPAPAAASAASVEETGPHFFDEDPVEDPVADPVQEPPAGAASQHGSRPEPASAWGADPTAQAGSGRVAWPDAQAADPRVPHARTGGSGDPASGPAAPVQGASPAEQSAAGSAAVGSAAGQASGDAAPADAERGVGSTFVFRRPTAGPQAAQAADAPAADEGTITFRAVPPRAASGGAQAAAARAAVQGTAGPRQAPSGPQQAGAPAGPAVPRQNAAPQPQPVQQQPVQPQPVQPQPGGSAAPVAVGPGGGQSSWAQQVHRLAGAGGDEQPVAPWKPPVDDVFQAAARRQAAARPAGLGKRLAARLIDTVVLAAVTAVAAVPLGTKAVDHVDEKIDAAKLSGETVTVWLLDGTTGTYLGIVLAVLLLFGVVYEALPTAKWGRTLGKRLLGLEVRDIEAHDAPSFGAALRRWLVYSVPGLLVVGVVGVAWCLFDRPWHQCWHDKAAGTFVAG